MLLTYTAIGIFAVAAILIMLFAVFLRRVVPTNEVHTIQTRKTTTSYGKDLPNGNVYYYWPSFLPIIGLERMVLPVWIFDLNFQNYEAYDRERVPFVVDITAFFRISDPNTAAQRVSNFNELKEQLMYVVQGAVRTTLAQHEIDSIMIDRSKFGEYFTQEVKEQLIGWGVESVKNIELMDIRDTRDSEVISNIMAKRTSSIEKESRVVVAQNNREAEMAEIDASRDVDVRRQDALLQVGQRTAETDKAVGIAKEQSQQEVLSQQRETTSRQMAVQQVEEVRQAEIAREVRLVEADEKKQANIIEAEGQREQTVIVATGQLEAKKREAQGIQVEGEARAEAEKAMQLAPVEAQIVLAKEIGENQGYQTYLISIRNIEAGQVVGIEAARALQQADLKVISNAGTPSEGVVSLMDLLSARGGTALGAALEALRNVPAGKAALDSVTIDR